MNQVDREAFEAFRAGTSKEARVALGHLLRNAMQPAMLHTTIKLTPQQAQDLLERSTRALKKMALLVDDLTK